MVYIVKEELETHKSEVIKREEVNSAENLDQSEIKRIGCGRSALEIESNNLDPIEPLLTLIILFSSYVLVGDYTRLMEETDKKHYILLQPKKYKGCKVLKDYLSLVFSHFRDEETEDNEGFQKTEFSSSMRFIFKYPIIHSFSVKSPIFHEICHRMIEKYKQQHNEFDKKNFGIPLLR